MSLGDWVQIFKTGRHTDRKGHKKTYTTKDLDNIVSKYKPEVLAAPAVVGHPKTNSPAFGWVDAVKREGDFLLAKFKQVMPEFESAVLEGRYPNRSVALDDIHGLRHVGFLGGQAPAIKGLENIAYSYAGLEAPTVFEFSETLDSTNDDEENSMNLEELQAENKKLEATIARLKAVNKAKDVKIAEYSEEMITKDAKIVELEQKATTTPETKEFSEEDSQLKKELVSAQNEINTLKQNALKRECEEFCEGLILEGKLPPAEKQSSVEMMLKLDSTELKEFSECNERTMLDEYKDQLSKRPVIMAFAEQATKKNCEVINKASDDLNLKGVKINDERAELHAQAKEYAENNNVSFREAIFELDK